MAVEFTQAQLASAMEKLLDGSWRLTAKEIDTEIDRVTYFEVVENGETLATTYDRLDVVLRRAIKRSTAESKCPRCGLEECYGQDDCPGSS